jgi:hypothetical protein
METYKGFTVSKTENGWTIHDPLYPTECQNVGLFRGYFDAIGYIDQVLELENQVVPHYCSHNIFKSGVGTWKVVHCVGTEVGSGQKFASVRQAIYFIDKVIRSQFQRRTACSSI